MSYHDPVLLAECLEGLNIDPAGSYVDVTPLAAVVIAKPFWKSSPPESSMLLTKTLMLRPTFLSIPTWYLSQPISATSKILRLHGARKVDGILGDLGVSSHQFDIGERGFSIRFDGPLDMRMNPSSGISAAEVLETYEEQALYDLFRKHTDIKGLRSLIHALLMAC